VKLDASEPSLKVGTGLQRAQSLRAPAAPLDKIRLGVLGAGNYASSTLLPAIKGLPSIELVGIASRGGLTARSSGEKYGFKYCASEIDEILTDSEINTVAVLTRHNLHARQVVAALKAGKHTFVEKPLCLTEEELQSIISTYESLAPATQDQDQVSGVRGQGPGDERQPASPPLLMVGFNRRFAPFVVELKQSLKGIREPLMMHYRVNAGYIPPQHWTHDPEEGGGRLLGEGCHFIDLLIHLAGEHPVRVTTQSLPDGGRYSHDNLLIVLEFGGGSIGTITYLANGDKGFGKEMLEVSGGGLSARLDDYRTLHIAHGGRQLRRSARLRQDKGHRAEWQALTAYLTGAGPRPISFDEIVLSTRATLAAQRSLESGEPAEDDSSPVARRRLASSTETEDEEPAL
jgi:predicted dehydrogenase